MESYFVSKDISIRVLRRLKESHTKKTGSATKKVSKREKKRIEVRTLYKDAGLSGAEIMRRTGYPKSFVYDHIALEKAGAPVEDRPHTGRPKKVTKSVAKKIVRLSKGKEKRSVRKVSKLLSADDIDLSRETVRRTLHEQGLIPHRQVPRSRMTEDQQLRRLKFSQDFLTHDWRYTLFTDEKHFTTFSPPNRRNDVIWDVRGIEYVFEKVRHPPQTRFWGGISYLGKTTLAEYEGTINTEKYIEVIKGEQANIYKMFGKHPFWFQQAGATAHTSSGTQEFLRKTFAHFLKKGKWPANNPDLNVIENLWGIINDRVWAADPQGIDELRQLIHRTWNALEPELLQNLVDSMRERLQQCIERKGLWTDY
jgi:hypothetical protein